MVSRQTFQAGNHDHCLAMAMISVLKGYDCYAILRYYQPPACQKDNEIYSEYHPHDSSDTLEDAIRPTAEKGPCVIF